MRLLTSKFIFLVRGNWLQENMYKPRSKLTPLKDGLMLLLYTAVFTQQLTLRLIKIYTNIYTIFDLGQQGVVVLWVGRFTMSSLG
jgi:hypothetical protein